MQLYSMEYLASDRSLQFKRSLENSMFFLHSVHRGVIKSFLIMLGIICTAFLIRLDAHSPTRSAVRWIAAWLMIN